MSEAVHSIEISPATKVNILSKADNKAKKNKTPEIKKDKVELSFIITV